MSRRLSITLTEAHESTYVGDILRYELHISDAVVRRIKWLPEGILLDGEKVHTRVKGKAGQVLSALIGETGRRSVIPSVEGPLSIVYEDEDFLLLNKGAGVVVHPTHAHKEDTIGNFVLYYYDSKGFQGDFHPVHRLDRGTSGLLVVAKHPFAQEQFKLQLHSPQFRREYLAIVWGKVDPPQGRIDGPILSTGQMMRVVDPTGLPAVTHYETISQSQWQGREISLVSATLESGRTHQIRVHFSHLGHPLLGDELYGAGDFLSHTGLHAYRLSLAHPVTKEDMVFHCKPPEDFCEILQQANLSLPACFL